MTPTRPWAAFQAVVWASSTLVQTPIALARVSANAAPPTTDPMIDQLEAAAAAASAAIAMSRSIRSCHRARMTLSTLVTAGQPHNVTRSGLDTGNGWQDLPADLRFLPEINLPALLCEADRRAAYLDFVTPGALPDGYAADDGCALLWRGGRRRRG